MKATNGLNPERSERSKALDQLGGWHRKPVKRGDSLDESLRLLQLGVNETRSSVSDIMDTAGDRARIDLQEATIAQLKKVIVNTRHENRDSHADIQAAKKRLQKEEAVLKEMYAEARVYTATVEKKKSQRIPQSAVALDPDVKRVWVTADKAGKIKEDKIKEKLALEQLEAGGGPALSRPSTNVSRSVSVAGRRKSVDNVPSSMGVIKEQPQTAKTITQFDPEFFGLPPFTPEWRVNVARAKRTFHLAFIGSRAFQYRLVLKKKPISRIMRVPSFSVHIPMVLKGDLQRFANEQQQVMAKHKKHNAPAKDDPSITSSPAPPLGKLGSMPKIGSLSRQASRSRATGGRRASTGSPATSIMGSFRHRSGTGMSTPNSFGFAESVIPTASELGEIANLADLIGVQDFEIPEEATKNVNMMTMYCNRGNSAWTDDWDWSCGKAFDLDTFQRAGGLSYNHFKLSATELYTEGLVAFQVFDSDVMMGLLDGEQLPLWLQDPWDMVQDSLGEGRMPLGDHFEGLTYFSRLLISLHIALDAAAGTDAAKKIKIVMHLPTDYAAEIVHRIVMDKFYGFPPHNIIFIPQSRFSGYCYDKKTNMFKQVEDSLRDQPGSGESMRQLMYLYEGFTVDRDGKKHTIQGSVLDVLHSSGVKWMRSMFIDDIIAAHSDNILDIPSLAMTLKSNETYKTNVVVQAVPAPDVNYARRNGSIILNAQKPGEKASGPFAGDPRFNVWQLMMDDLQPVKWSERLNQLSKDSSADKTCHFLTSTNRFFFSIADLEKSLTTRGLFHVSLALQGPYVYPKLHVCDITTGANSHSVAFTTNLPATSNILDSAAFSEQLLPLLTQQDKWPLFRRNIGKWAVNTVTVVTRHSAAYKPAPRRFVLVVADNEVSRDAYDFFCGAFGNSFTADDTLYIVTSGKAPQQEEDLHAFLASFKDEFMDLHNVKRDVLMRSDKSLIQVLENYIEERRPYLVVMGTDGMTDQGKLKDNGVKLGSVTIHLAKNVTHSLLVVKNSRACALTRNSDGGSEPIKVMFQADNTAQATFEFLTTLLDKKRGDTVWFAKPWGRDSTGAETNSAKAVLSYYSDMANDLGFTSQRKPLEGDGKSFLPQAAEQEHSHIVAVHTGKAKVLADATRDILVKSPCAVLINKV